MNAFDAAEKNGRGADLQNDATSIPTTFLRVTMAP
jgi:hypothetical protein